MMSYAAISPATQISSHIYISNGSLHTYKKMVSNTGIIILHMQINMDVEQVPIN
jgi:hypothetical protein